MNNFQKSITNLENLWTIRRQFFLFTNRWMENNEKKKFNGFLTKWVSFCNLFVFKINHLPQKTVTRRTQKSGKIHHFAIGVVYNYFDVPHT
jgi:hypothetical protein